MHQVIKRKSISFWVLLTIIPLVVVLFIFQKKFFLYWLILLFSSSMPIAFLCGLGRKNGSYIYASKSAELWNALTKKIVNFCIYVCIVLISLGSLIFIVYPMILDLPFVLSDETLSVSGKVTYATEADNRHKDITQELTVNNQYFQTYFIAEFSKGDEVEIDYLPNSRLVVQVYELVD